MSHHGHPGGDIVRLTAAPLYKAWLWYRLAEAGERWAVAYCVLSQGFLLFFSSEEICQSCCLSTLQVNTDSSVENGEVDPVSGCVFYLRLTPANRIEFRVKTAYEREQWRVRLVGMITGRVPQDSTLPPSELQHVTSQLLGGHWNPPPPPMQAPVPPSPTSCSRPSIRQPGGDSSGRKDDWHSPPLSPADRPPLPPPPAPCPGPARKMSLGVLQSREQPQHSRATDRRGSLPAGGPPSVDDMVRRTDSVRSTCSIQSNRSSGFIDDGYLAMDLQINKKQTMRASTPSWLLDNCSREQAERVLTSHPGIGNTLMRPSANTNGGYAISKCIRTDKSCVVEHYHVVPVAGGFRINVDNCPAVLPSLEDVMNEFIRESGVQSTRPLTSNDLDLLDNRPYQDFIRNHDELDGAKNRPPPLPARPGDIDEDDYLEPLSIQIPEEVIGSQGDKRT